MTLEEFLLHKTRVNNYVKIFDGGYLVAMCCIDIEDLFINSLSQNILNREIQNTTQYDVVIVRDDLSSRRKTIYEVNLKY